MKPARILVVDDYADSRELYRDYLVALGHMCATAEDGAEAVAKARVLRPDVVVMDIAMPVLDGWSAIQMLREMPETRRCAVIVVTGQEGSPGEGARHAAALGARRFFTKPCLPRELAQAIAEVLAERAGEVDRVGACASSQR